MSDADNISPQYRVDALLASDHDVDALQEQFANDPALKQRHYDIFKIEQPQIFELITQFGHRQNETNALPEDQYESMRDYVVAFYSVIRRQHELDEIYDAEVEHYFSYIQRESNTSSKNSVMNKAFADKIKLLGKKHEKELTYITHMIFAISMSICMRVLNLDEEDDEDEVDAEEYDFDEDNLSVLQLRVKLCGSKTYADILIREDQTFEDLHDCINTLFQRDDEHLYRFECDDGFTAAHEGDDDEEAIPAGDCFVGHHLSKGSGAHYLYDYGDEWEHDIKVTKILTLDPSTDYPKTIKVSGAIPEQYPENDEE